MLHTLAEQNSWLDPDSLRAIARESLVLLTAVIFFIGTIVVFKLGIIPALTLFRDGTVGLAQASSNIKDGIKDNLQLAETLRDLHASRKKENE